VEHDFFVPASVIGSFGVPHTEVDLILVGGESSDFCRLVHNGGRIGGLSAFQIAEYHSEAARPSAASSQSQIPARCPPRPAGGRPAS